MTAEENIGDKAYQEAFERTFEDEYARRIKGGEEPDDARDNARFFAKDCADAASAEAVNNYRLLPEDH